MIEPIASVLRNVPLFRELDEQEFLRIVDIASVQTFQRKTNVFMEGETRQAVYFIHSGYIKAYKTDVNGNEHIINFLKDGDMFPHVGFFDTSPYPATTEVMEPATLVVIPIQSFEKTILENPTISIKVMRVMGQKILELQAKLQTFSIHDVNVRIITFLLQLAKDHGISSNNQTQIDLPLTNQEMANMLGTSRETVNRLFNQLKKKGLLSIGRKKILIHDLHALEDLLEK